MTRPSRIRFEIFNRPNVAGEDRYYVRFFDASGDLICTRSTGTSTKSAASEAIAELLHTLPLERMARAKKAGYEDELDAEEKLKETPSAQFVADFWGPKSEYLSSRIDEGRPLSGQYVKVQRRYVARFITNSVTFKKTRLRDVTLVLVERWVREIKAGGADGNLVNDALNCIRTPLSWAKKRNLLDEPFDFKAISRPKEKNQARGVLTAVEVRMLIDLPVQSVWTPKTGDEVARADVKPRGHLKGGQTNEGPAPIDLRMKVAVLLSELAGLRRGEIRGLRWQAVDFENRILHVEENIVPNDAPKGPKGGSAGTVPISDDLLSVLEDLRVLAFKLGRFRPEEYVIFNIQPGAPVAEITIKRGFERALELIGIAEAVRKSRRLTLHSGRHFFATRLADEIGPRAAARLTRHRSAAAFDRYAAHDTPEALERARDAMRLPKNGGKAK
ncbi:MAG: site-specific integrase [Rectinemataceae bacterium]|jgi:integrase